MFKSYEIITYIIMPVVIDDVKILMKFLGKDKMVPEGKLGDVLAMLGKKVKGGEPTRDIRKLREDEDVFD